ncbi:hypothetical protein SAM23877_0557 [Streptomyces ambofaciens ATCC 23877]|uniref:Uncharacterized protein n=1 Tax=Streptomyces ambofaciens (strain ATCC 23877 / 3486 / DSM 40053 / JCM 4204 / NBRC 12836 / NRRL B-2516) TaxID=278992 RepID=A0A0K2AL21_STRA7|nr:hypothetical protein SAM23877_0557 [Streptomyces ambofaciens ATCC 23877]
MLRTAHGARARSFEHAGARPEAKAIRLWPRSATAHPPPRTAVPAAVGPHHPDASRCPCS